MYLVITSLLCPKAAYCSFEYTDQQMFPYYMRNVTYIMLVFLAKSLHSAVMLVRPLSCSSYKRHYNVFQAG